MGPSTAEMERLRLLLSYITHKSVLLRSFLPVSDEFTEHTFQCQRAHANTCARSNSYRQRPKLYPPTFTATRFVCPTTNTKLDVPIIPHVAPFGLSFPPCVLTWRSKLTRVQTINCVALSPAHHKTIKYCNSGTTCTHARPSAPSHLLVRQRAACRTDRSSAPQTLLQSRGDFVARTSLTRIYISSVQSPTAQHTLY
jgi:hypothetical protein